MFAFVCLSLGRITRELFQRNEFTFRLYIGSFPCVQLPGLVHTARLGRVCFFVYLA